MIDNQNVASQMSPIHKVCHFVTPLIFLALVASGCSRRYDDLPAYMSWWPEESPNASVGRFKTTYLAQQIDEYYRGTNPGPLGVTTFVNLDDLYVTSSFGRMLGEQLMSELAMRGFDVIELRHADALRFMTLGGEFGLSRDIAAVRRERELGGIVVGTYVVSPIRVYVNARLVDPTSSMVLSAGSVEMSKTSEIAKLLRGGSTPGTLERIPVKHLGFATMPLELFPAHMRSMYDMEESAPWASPRPEAQFSPGKPSIKSDVPAK